MAPKTNIVKLNKFMKVLMMPTSLQLKTLFIILMSMLLNIEFVKKYCKISNTTEVLHCLSIKLFEFEFKTS